MHDIVMEADLIGCSREASKLSHHALLETSDQGHIIIILAPNYTFDVKSTSEERKPPY